MAAKTKSKPKSKSKAEPEPESEELETPPAPSFEERYLSRIFRPNLLLAAALLGTGFVLAADFAERVHEFFHAGTTEFQGAGRTFSELRLQAEMNHTESAPLREALANDLTGLVASGEAVTAFIASLLQDRRRLPHSPRFASLVNDVFQSYSLLIEFPEGPAGPLAPPTPDHMWRVYAQRRAALETRVGARLTAVFRQSRNMARTSPSRDCATGTAML